MANCGSGEHANEAGEADLRRFHGAHHHHPTEYQKPTQVRPDVESLIVP
jgi:hypothetical protein